MQLVLATRNRHKVRELAALLPSHRIEPLPDGIELPPETGDTFTENALIKARAVAAALGVAALADDSGIAVTALDGAPGVHSARYGGYGATDQQNLAKLMEVMDGERDRRAAYVCVLALAWPDGREETFEGVCTGRLINEARGTGGFGYDPIFVPDQAPAGDERTMAERTAAEKDLISHRGNAARRLAARLGSA